MCVLFPFPSPGTHVHRGIAGSALPSPLYCGNAASNQMVQPDMASLEEKKAN